MSNPTLRASLAPIVVALLAVASVSLFGFTVAYWPEEQPRTPHAAESSLGIAPQSFDGESSFVPPARERGRARWM
jgi:hypothetical protein